jgi:NhaP-type Na+/H+ or K+/H+ antiporter
MSQDALLVGLTLVVVLAVTGRVLADRLGLPSILVLLVLGVIAGPITGLLDPDAILGDLLIPLVSLAVAVILFEGGLLLDLRELTSGLTTVTRRLLWIGLLLTWIVASVTAVLVLDLEHPIPVVLGAILTVSGPTVVMPLLRFIRPSADVESILKWEGIFIDPLGAILGVVVFQAVIAQTQRTNLLLALLDLAGTVAVGGLAGAAGAWLMRAVLASRRLDREVEVTATLAVVVAVYVAADLARSESGLLAAVLMGVALANADEIDLGRIAEFESTLGSLLTSVLFIVLSARLDAGDLFGVGPRVLVLVAVLVLVVRPAVAALATIRSSLSWRKRALLGWVAPRGIVAAATASTFGLRLVDDNVPGADQLVPITFVVIFATVAIYGLTTAPLARALGLTRDDDAG